MLRMPSTCVYRQTRLTGSISCWLLLHGRSRAATVCDRPSARLYCSIILAPDAAVLASLLSSTQQWTFSPLNRHAVFQQLPIRRCTRIPDGEDTASCSAEYTRDTTCRRCTAWAHTEHPSGRLCHRFLVRRCLLLGCIFVPFGRLDVLVVNVSTGILFSGLVGLSLG